MGQFKGTQIHEPGGSETLALEPSFHQDDIYMQNIYIAPAEDTVSVVSLQHYDRSVSVTHFWFTPEEIDILVKALLEAKEKIVEESEFTDTA